MQDIQNAAYLVTILLGFVSFPLLSELRQRLDLHHNVTDTIARELVRLRLVTVCVLLLGISAALMWRSAQYYTDDSIFFDDLLQSDTVLTRSRFFVEFFLGFSTGVLARYFWQLSGEELSTSILVPASRAISIIVLLCFGLLRDEIAELSVYFKSVHTPYLQLEFRDNQDSLPAFDQINDQPSPGDTPFREGVFAYKSSVKAPLKQARRLLDLCSETGAALCGRSPDFGIENERIREYFQNALRYSALVHPYKHCIDSFKESFANGVPIQDELSEMAIEYARSAIPPETNINTTSRNINTDENDQDNYSIRNNEETNLAKSYNETYFDSIRHMEYGDKIFDNMFRGAKISFENGIINKIIDPECKWTTNLSNTMQFVRLNYLLLQKEYNTAESDSASRGDPLPYAAMIGSSILHMSGHVEEAAENLNREFLRWLRVNRIEVGDYGLRKSERFGKMDLLTFMSGLEFLARLEYALEKAKKNSDLRKIRDKMRNFVSLFLVNRTNVQLQVYNTGDYIRSALESCRKYTTTIGKEHSLKFNIVDDALNRPVLPLKYKSKTDLRELQFNSPTTNSANIRERNYITEGQNTLELILESDEFDNTNSLTQNEYIRSILRYLVYLSIENYQSIANSRDLIPLRAIEKAKDMNAIALEKPNLIEDCFGSRSSQGNALSIFDYRVIRFLFSFTYGEMMAQKGVELQKKARSSARSNYLEKDVVKALCAAEGALNFAISLAKDTEDGDGEIRDGNPIKKEYDRANYILQKIPPKLCGT